MNYKALYEKQKELIELQDCLISNFRDYLSFLSIHDDDTAMGCSKQGRIIFDKINFSKSELSALESEEHELIVPSEEDIKAKAENYASMEDSNRQHFIDGSSYEGYVDGFNDAISEIKKLNK